MHEFPMISHACPEQHFARCELRSAGISNSFACFGEAQGLAFAYAFAFALALPFQESLDFLPLASAPTCRSRGGGGVGRSDGGPRDPKGPGPTIGPRTHVRTVGWAAVSPNVI